MASSLKSLLWLSYTGRSALDTAVSYPSADKFRSFGSTRFIRKNYLILHTTGINGFFEKLFKIFTHSSLIWIYNFLGSIHLQILGCLIRHGGAQESLQEFAYEFPRTRRHDARSVLDLGFHKWEKKKEIAGLYLASRYSRIVTHVESTRDIANAYQRTTTDARDDSGRGLTGRGGFYDPKMEHPRTRTPYVSRVIRLTACVDAGESWEETERMCNQGLARRTSTAMENDALMIIRLKPSYEYP